MLDRVSSVSARFHPAQFRSRSLGQLLWVALSVAPLGCANSAIAPPPSAAPVQPGAITLPDMAPAAMLPSPATPTPNTIAGLLKTWPRYQSPQAGFAVAFPAKPQEETSRVPTEVGPAEVIMLRYQDRAAKRFYLFAHNRFPVPAGTGLDVAKALDASRDSIAKGISAKVVSEKPLQQSGFQGRDVELSRAGGFAARVRIFYANGIWYRAIVAAEDGKLKVPPVQAFFDSIQLVSPTDARKVSPAPASPSSSPKP